MTARGRRGAGNPQGLRETSAGGVVVRVVGGEPRYLLIRDAHGNWGFPKGHLEAGEQPEAAAIREVMEETGLPSLTLRAPIAAIQWTFTWRGSLVRKRCHFFLMETDHERTAPQADEGITECRWASAEEAQRLIRYPNARGILRRAGAMLVALSA